MSIQPASVVFALLVCVPLIARAGSSVTVNSAILDTEHKFISAFQPSVEFELSASSESKWSVSSQFQLVPPRRDNSFRTQVTFSEAELTRSSENHSYAIGRFLLRTDSSNFNEAAKSFLHGELSADGFRFASSSQPLRWTLFFGGPLVAGATLESDFGSSTMSIVYRGERNRLSDVSLPAPTTTPNQQAYAAHTHEAEFSLMTKSETFQTEGILQIRSQGPQRKTTVADWAKDDYSVGGIDNGAQSSKDEYCAGAQVRFLLGQSNASSDWVIISGLANSTVSSSGRTAADQKPAQKSGYGAQLALFFETSSKKLNVQLGSTFQYSSAETFNFAGKKESSGEPSRRRFKSQLLSSIRFDL
jgi:hypothetical protein